MKSRRGIAIAAGAWWLIAAAAWAQPAGTPASVSGRVTTAAGVVPSGVIVTAYRDFDDRLATPLGLVEVSADGLFEMRNLPTGPVRFNVQAPCFATAQYDVDLRAGMNGSSSVVLHRTGTVSGRVHGPDFQPLVDALITLQPVPGTRSLRQPAFNLPCDARRSAPFPTDAAGRYQMPDVTPGSYFVVVTRRGEAGARVFYPDSHTIETAVAIVIEESGVLRDIDVVWSPPAQAITGRVVDVRGRSVRNVVVEYGQEGGTHRGTRTITAADGTFVIFDPLLPNGAVTLIARGETDGGPVIGIVRIAVDGGHTDITLNVSAPGRVTGRVFLEDLSVLPGRLELRLVPVGFVARSATSRAVDISPGEAFALEGLSGEYYVQLASDAWTIASVRRGGQAVAGGRFEIGAEETVDLDVTVRPRR